MAGASPAYMTKADLEERVGATTVAHLFDDDGDGTIASGSQDETTLNSVMAEAEALALSRMLRGYTEAQVVTLAGDDPSFTAQVAWVALELASERRSEFIAADGKGRYWTQYERAVDFFDRLSKSRIHSKGEAAAGGSSNTGGNVSPKKSDGTKKTFVFASDTDAPTGRGGF